jgi:hypothetical protein
LCRTVGLGKGAITGLKSVVRKDCGFDFARLEKFAEILPRFISKPTSHKPHKRTFSDRDLLFYWLYALGDVGAIASLVFITPKVGGSIPPPATNKPSPHNNLQGLLNLDRFCFAEILPRMKNFSAKIRIEISFASQ